MCTGTPTCTMYWYKSPSGKMFRGKKTALRFMESSKHCTSDDVRKFKSAQGNDKKFTKVELFYSEKYIRRNPQYLYILESLLCSFLYIYSIFQFETLHKIDICRITNGMTMTPACPRVGDQLSFR